MKAKKYIAAAALFVTLGVEAPLAADTPYGGHVRFAIATPNDTPHYVLVAKHRRTYRRHHRRVVVRRRSKKKSLAIVAGSAAGGAAIGALAGGGKGAAIGALAGGGAGYVYDRATHKKVRRY